MGGWVVLPVVCADDGGGDCLPQAVEIEVERELEGDVAVCGWVGGWVDGRGG